MPDASKTPNARSHGQLLSCRTCNLYLYFYPEPSLIKDTLLLLTLLLKMQPQGKKRTAKANQLASKHTVRKTRPYSRPYSSRYPLVQQAPHAGKHPSQPQVCQVLQVYCMLTKRELL
ncbi:expressed unknown protein [Seminavis robusta]|uniref:Uncharacterized protein n=1 Tax=Seminavis robusta TaxID=568900 RepID=A0A9N8D5M1_9STRA|nr:expressed unknown protein [Seminavis robusta]|eukprot:Sro10_g008101.1  (117) ;mRNA; f:120017-120367